MGLYPQPNKWQCGPFALKYALIMLGRIVDENRISHIAGTHWWTGTDEIKLARAAKVCDCEMKVIRRKDSLRAKRELVRSLKKGTRRSCASTAGTTGSPWWEWNGTSSFPSTAAKPPSFAWIPGGN